MTNIVKCYFANLSESNLEEQRSILGHSRSSFAMKIRHMVNQKASRQSIIGRHLLARATGIPFEEIIRDEVVTQNKFGKPVFVNSSRGFFSISHSSDLVVVSLSKFPIGIDVEESISHSVDLPYAALCEHEKRIIKHSDYSAFLQFWVKKESVLKLLGTGLYIPPNILDCSINPIHFCDNGNEQYDSLNIFAKSFILQRFYEAAIATFHSDVRIQCQHV